MKYLLIIGLMMMASLSKAQTFSRILDPLDGTYNYINDMQVHDGSIYISSYHCRPDLPWPKLGCNQQSKWSLTGDLEKSVLLDSLFSQGTNNVELLDDKIGFSGTWVQKEYTYENPISVLEFDPNLDLVSKQQTHSVEGEHFLNDGLVNIKGYNYLYGYIQDQSSDVYEKAQIFEVKDSGNDFKDTRFVRAAGPPGFNNCHDLQATQDGNLIYINEFSDWVGAGGESGTQIMIIDQDGHKLDSLEFKGESKHLRVLASNEGPIYCMTKNHPEPINNLPSHGRINKYSSDLDSLLWSVELPFNNFIDGRRHIVRDFIQATNGDIMVCGTVWDEGADGPIENGLDHCYNGFVARVSQEGELEWIHIYKIPITHELLPTDEYGRFRTTSLQKIEELSDGRFMLGGIAEYNTKQFNVLFPAEETVSHVWLLTIGEDGCVDGEECQEVIILDGKNSPNVILTQNTKWNHCLQPDFFDNQSVNVHCEVVDTMSKHGMKGFLVKGNFIKLQNDLTKDSIWIFEDGNKVFYEMEDSLHILYDFDLYIGDTLKVQFPHSIDPTFKELFPDKKDVFEWEVVWIEPIEVDGKYLMRQTLKSLDEDELVFMGEYVTQGMGFQNWMFPYLSPSFMESNVDCQLIDFKTDSIQFANTEVTCNLFQSGARRFADINSKWHHCLVIDGQEPWTYDHNNEVIDTFTQNGRLYSTIKGGFIGHSVNPPVDSILIVNEEHKVYYQEGDTLYLLYDFDVNAGDTLSLRFPVFLDMHWYDSNPTVSPYYKIIVDSIATIDIDGELLQRVYFNEFNELDDDHNYIWTPTDLGRYYTEKLGYENFIVPYIVTGYDENNTGCDLKEYSDDEISYVNNNAYCFTVNTKDILSNDEIKLYPNPAMNEIRIHSNQQFDSISIVNSIGEIVYFGTFSTTISTSNFSNGIYYVVFTSHEMNKNYSSKLVINR